MVISCEFVINCVDTGISPGHLQLPGISPQATPRHFNNSWLLKMVHTWVSVCVWYLEVMLCSWQDVKTFHTNTAKCMMYSAEHFSLNQNWQWEGLFQHHSSLFQMLLSGLAQLVLHFINCMKEYHQQNVWMRMTDGVVSMLFVYNRKRLQSRKVQCDYSINYILITVIF